MDIDKYFIAIEEGEDVYNVEVIMGEDMPQTLPSNGIQVPSAA